MEALVNVLRPDFRCEGEALANVQRLEKIIFDATEKQAATASLVLEIKRLVLKGAAGTGKTYIALRLAKFFAESGLRVGFLCFNSLLGAWLKKEMGAAIGEHGYVGTFSKLMLELTNEQVPPGADSEFWRDLTKRALTQLIEADEGSKFDVLVVDEAQDLLQSDMVDALDLLLEGGLKDGRWVFSGDFSGQAIFAAGATEEKLLARLDRKGIAQATVTLRENCRNALRITENIQILTNPSIGYSSCLGADFPGEFKPHFGADSPEALSRILEKVIVELRRKFKPEEIVVLSRLNESTASSLATSQPGLNLRELKDAVPEYGFSGYSTVHAFKGLDAPAIILTDVASLGDSLFYTGISRGRQEVHVLLPEGMKQAYAAKIVG
ncbi:DNA/RNA helicase domain-containing protein [Luteimonas pelagia]